MKTTKALTPSSHEKNACVEHGIVNVEVTTNIMCDCETLVHLQIYCRREKINWAEHSQFQFH